MSYTSDFCGTSRLISQYGRNSTSVFPTGNYQGAAGGVMGTVSCLPLT
jgi:hypothetical protein